MLTHLQIISACYRAVDDRVSTLVMRGLLTAS